MMGLRQRWWRGGGGGVGKCQPLAARALVNCETLKTYSVDLDRATGTAGRGAREDPHVSTARGVALASVEHDVPALSAGRGLAGSDGDRTANARVAGADEKGDRSALAAVSSASREVDLSRGTNAGRARAEAESATHAVGTRIRGLHRNRARGRVRASASRNSDRTTAALDTRSSGDRDRAAGTCSSASAGTSCHGNRAASARRSGALPRSERGSAAGSRCRGGLAGSRRESTAGASVAAADEKGDCSALRCVCGRRACDCTW